MKNEDELSKDKQMSNIIDFPMDADKAEMIDYLARLITEVREDRCNSIIVTAIDRDGQNLSYWNYAPENELLMLGANTQLIGNINFTNHMLSIELDEEDYE